MVRKTVTYVITALLILGTVAACNTATVTPTTITVTLPPDTIAAPTPTIPPTSPPSPQPPADHNPVEGWGVLAQKDDYSDVDMTDLPTDYIGLTSLREQLLAAGWQEDHIREAREFDRDDLRESLVWLAENADENDVVFFYVAAHGMYLREVVQWGDFFAADWAAVPSDRRVLVVDSCQAALLTAAANEDPRPHLSIAAVDADEYGWSGLPEEGLPIIGGVFTHYFAAAFDDPDADADGNGSTSLQEAARWAEAQQRAYMHDVVFAVPEFAEMYAAIGVHPEEDPEFPTVVIDDTIGQPLYLDLTASEGAEATAPWPTDGWQTSTPEAQGIDSEALAAMLSGIQEYDPDIDSITVIRNGYMVLDVAIAPFRPDERHIIHSCTKSIVSGLIGIAIDEGAIAGIDQSVLSFFPDRTAANLDPEKEEMTLEDVLTMSTGWECRDSYLYRWRGISEMRASGDWVQFVLDLPMEHAPGTHFEYCNGASFLLSAIVQEATGMTAREFADEHLFGPLGITDVEWPTNPDGINIGWGELHLRPHDIAKIGYLYLNEGHWDGEQIVPAEWVAASTRSHIDATLQDGYGYQWWIDDDGFYMALGYAGQFIYVVPELDMVVVFTSDLPEDEFYTPQTLLEEAIIPAAVSQAPLPDNPEGVVLMESLVTELQEMPH
jgi:CubicO group peptidase (beta-lactamase class C family)